MSELVGIAGAMGATNKYVLDLILDVILYKGMMNIPLGEKKDLTNLSTSHKIRLADRHIPYATEYAERKHLPSISLAVNLILNDYFFADIDTKKSDVAQITPHRMIKTESSTKKSDVAQITPHQTELEPIELKPELKPTELKPEGRPRMNKGQSLLEKLKL
jgi:hypothetical protein